MRRLQIPLAEIDQSLSIHPFGFGVSLAVEDVSLAVSSGRKRSVLVSSHPP